MPIPNNIALNILLQPGLQLVIQYITTDTSKINTIAPAIVNACPVSAPKIIMNAANSRIVAKYKLLQRAALAFQSSEGEAPTLTDLPPNASTRSAICPT